MSGLKQSLSAKEEKGRIDPRSSAALMDGPNAPQDDSSFPHLLTNHLVDLIAGHQGRNEPIRCWVPACGQGEVAYELAVMLANAFGNETYYRRFKIFATEGDPKALAKARSGRLCDADDIHCLQATAHIDREYELPKIGHKLRELMIFAEHDLLRDPPITRLDLIRSGDILLELNNKEKRRLIELFYYCLNPGGYLILHRDNLDIDISDCFEYSNDKLPLFRRKTCKQFFAQGLFPTNRLANQEKECRVRKPAIQQQLECDVEELLTLNDQLQVTSDEILFANEELRFLNQELLTRSDLMSSAMARLEVSEARYRSVVEDQSEYICRYRPDGTITFANVALCRALGLRLDQLTGRKFDTLWPHCGDLQARLAELSPEQPNQSLDLKIEVAGGHAAWQHWSDHAFFDSGGHVVEYQSVGEDVTDRIECERRYRYLAIHDQLTGLANRHGFFEHVNDVLAAARRTSQPVAVLYLDLDHFKDINDGLGHAVGDALLRSVGERLSNEIRSNDFLARLGGDEFAVVQTAAHDIDNVVHLAKRLIAAVQTPHHVAETCLKTSATLGIALFPDDGVDAGSLLDRADLAMYESKKRGGGRFGFFTKGLDERVAKQFQMKSELSAAINQNQFCIHYQPIVDLGKNRICAIEALLRWQHPIHGLLNASAFIDVLESIPEISAVSLWTLEIACQQAKTWVDQAGELIRLNVNLSGCMLREPALVANILAILDRTGFDPTRLELEVTEHAVIEIGLNEAADRLRKLSDLGIGIALDDFGTGYSSLTFLRTLPVSHIKIDRSFVAGLNNSTEDQAIVNAVIDLGRSLSLDVTAEGVEDKEVSACLQQSGCNQAQGYLYGAAVPAASIAGLIGKAAKGLQFSA